MELRGPILMVFAASLVLSPIVINSNKKPQIRLSSGVVASCSSFALASVGGKSGCRNTSWGGR